MNYEKIFSSKKRFIVTFLTSYLKRMTNKNMLPVLNLLTKKMKIVFIGFIRLNFLNREKINLNFFIEHMSQVWVTQIRKNF